MSVHNGWVTAGDYPPAVPTDPDVPDSSIRLLRVWRRCATINTVNDTIRVKRAKYVPVGTGVPGAEQGVVIASCAAQIHRSGRGPQAHGGGLPLLTTGSASPIG